MSPTRMRRLTAAVALEAITLWAGEPESVVTAIVVRTRAAGSAPAASSARLSSGCSRRALANSGRRAQRVRAARCRVNISSVGSGSEAANGRFSRRTTARAIRAVGPPGAGVEEWPPRPSARSSSVVVPFSETPITPSGGSTPGNASCAIAPPSSSTNHGVTPRRRSSSTAAVASGPETSSRAPKDSQTSRAGHEALRPAAARRRRRSRPASPCRRGCRGPRSRRRGSRPRTAGAARAPTRRSARRRCAPSARPGRRRCCPPSGRAASGRRTRCRVRCSCSSGNDSARTRSNSSNGGGSIASSSACDTVGMRTSVRSFSTSPSSPTGMNLDRPGSGSSPNLRRPISDPRQPTVVHGGARPPDWMDWSPCQPGSLHLPRCTTSSRSLRRRRLGEPLAPGVAAGWPRVIAPTGSKASGIANSARTAAHLVRRDAEEAGAEPLVDGGLQDQQRGHRGVHVPERHRPAGLVAVGPALVGLGVAPQVGGLARARHDHDRRAHHAAQPARPGRRCRRRWRPSSGVRRRGCRAPGSPSPG